MPQEGEEALTSDSEKKGLSLFSMEAEGILKDKLTGARVFVISRSGWRAFYEEMQGTFSEASLTILERFGYSYGRSIGRAAKGLNLDTVSTFESLFDLAANAGWGKVSLSAGKLSEGLGILRVESCVFCESMMGRRKDGCHFLPGVVRGVADVVMQKPHNTLETRCICKGDAACEINIDPRAV